jgi:hypothetical protein
MKIEMNDFERFTIRYAIYEALTMYCDHYGEDELESLQTVFERLDPTRGEHDNKAN